jgi:hypothetical protein
MTVEHSHYLQNPNATTPPPKIEVVATVAGAPPMPEGAEAMTILVTLPPGSEGAPPHRHSGPAFGYVVKGEIIFELEGEPQRVIRPAKPSGSRATTSSITRTGTTSPTRRPATRSASRAPRPAGAAL